MRGESFRPLGPVGAGLGDDDGRIGLDAIQRHHCPIAIDEIILREQAPGEPFIGAHIRRDDDQHEAHAG